MKLLGSIKDKNSDNVTHLEVVLVYCNIVNYKYQRDSWILSTFFSYKWFGQLMNISAMNQIYTETFRSKFSHIEIWFPNQNSKLLEIEERLNLTIVINEIGINSIY